MTEISYLIVNTNARDDLLRCLESVFATMPALECDVWVLDNASEDGSPEAVRESFGDRVQLLRLARRGGKPENASRLLEASTGRYCLFLDQDAELLPGAVTELHRVLEMDAKAAVAGAQLLSSDGEPQPCAWRFPSPSTALAGALFVHRRYTVQSGGDEVRQVDWVQSAAMLVRRGAYEEIGGLDPQFFVYSDEVDWCKRFHDGNWRVLYVPGATAIHHEQLGVPGEGSERRIVEFNRNRDRYMRKHHSPAAAAAVRVLTAWSYGARAVAATVTEDHDPRRFAKHAYYSLAPNSGEGLAEAAAKFNAGLPPGGEEE